MNEIQLKAVVEKITENKKYKDKVKALRYIYTNIVEFNINGQILYVSINQIKKEIDIIISDLTDIQLNIQEHKILREYILSRITNKKMIKKFKLENKQKLDKLSKKTIKELNNKLLLRENNKENQKKWNKLLQK